MTRYYITCDESDLSRHASTVMGVVLWELTKSGAITKEDADKYLDTHAVIAIPRESFIEKIANRLFGKDSKEKAAWQYAVIEVNGETPQPPNPDARG